MRKLMLAAALACGTAACAQGGDRTSLTSAASPPAESERIVVGAQSNVCVSVQVDQRIWPTPLDADSTRNFSGHLMTEVRRLYVERGGSFSLPGRNRLDRFVTNGDGTNPHCQDRQSDVFIDVRYGPRHDGTPFVIDYRIAGGSAVRSGRIEIDVAEEIRAGRIRGYSQRRTNVVIIGEDMWRRATMIADQLAVTQN